MKNLLILVLFAVVGFSASNLHADPVDEIGNASTKVGFPARIQRTDDE